MTGGFFDGPEWGTTGFTNMFASDVGSLNIKYPVNTAIGAFMKAHGGTVAARTGTASRRRRAGPPSGRTCRSSTRAASRACSTRPSRSVRWP